MILLQLFLCFCLCQAVPALAELAPKKCSPNQVTMTNLENQYEVTVSDLDLTVTFDHLDVLGEKATQISTEILVESTNVVVSGHLHPKESHTDSKLERSFKTESIIVRLSQEDSDQQRKKASCKVVGGKHSSKKNAQSRSSLTPQDRVESVLQGLIESCLEIQICEQFNAMLNDASVTRGHYEQKTKKTIVSILQRRNDPQTLAKQRVEEERSLQNTLNSLFDFGVGAGLTKLVGSNGIYHLPNIIQNYTAAGSTGDIKTFDGTFEGLTSLRRTKDIIFSNNKNHYTMGTTIRLANAKVNIPTYHGRYGYLNINGHVILNINGISLTIQVSVDYNSKPCKIHLDEMSIHDVGQIDVDISGLGWPLNNILEPIIRHIIRTTVFESAKEKGAEVASQLNCEEYRPTIEIMKDQP